MKLKKYNFSIAFFTLIISLSIIISGFSAASIPNIINLPVGDSFEYKQSLLYLKETNKEYIKTNSSTTNFIKTTKIANVTQISSDKVGKYCLEAKLFGLIPIKNVEINVTSKAYVVPGGNAIGIKMFTEGLLVVGISYVIGKNGVKYTPAKDCGLKEGDIIEAINDTPVSLNEDMDELIKDTIVKLKVKRDSQTIEINAKTIKSAEDNKYKLGIWVRDSSAGVGTMTFYDPKTGYYASLGHAITDVDVGSVLKVANGSLVDCSIATIEKGKVGVPGELRGVFEDNTVGTITENCNIGIYGKLSKPSILPETKPVEVLPRFKIKEGPAYILSTIDGEKIERFNIEIQKISSSQDCGNKGIVIKITDKNLLDKTGGIVQGMSGSPILQDGKLVGAVTHVFINDPTRGYGIFAEQMIDKINSIKG